MPGGDEMRREGTHSCSRISFSLDEQKHVMADGKKSQKNRLAMKEDFTKSNDSSICARWVNGFYDCLYVTVRMVDV